MLAARFFDPASAFASPVTLGATLAVAGILALTPIALVLIGRRRRRGENQQRELWQRYLTWLLLAPLMLGPVLLGPGLTVAAVALLSLLCYNEYARATGAFRERLISFLVVCGILAVNFAALDNWYDFFVALFPITTGLIAAAGILPDQPKGYIQRVALGVFAFVLFGSALGHLSLFTNDGRYRQILILLILAVSLNDVFAFISGKLFGKRKLAPQTSPGKTRAGAIGALLLTTALVYVLAGYVFAGTPLAHPLHRVVLGAMISVLGQLGDLMLSSIKRDIGVKDLGASLPGHGGLLDRFDSLILAAPGVYHYVHYFAELAMNEPRRVITGG